MGGNSALVDRLVAVEGPRGVQIEWLGDLVWFTITESEVDAAAVSSAAAAAGIDAKYLPGATHPKDAMRRAARAAEIKRSPIGDPKEDRYLNLLVREVAQTPTGLVYHLVREIVDGNNRRLEYVQVAEIEQDGEQVRARPMPGETPTPIEEVAIAGATAAFGRHLRYHDGAAIRRTVTRVLADCHPVAVRPSGGVTFVPLKYEPTVQALREFVAAVAKYGTTSAHQSVLRAVPVVDAAEQREMVRASLEEQVNAEADGLLREMQQAASGKVSAKVAEGFVARVQALQASAGDYEEVLKTKQTNVEAVLDLVMRQARRLVEDAE